MPALTGLTEQRRKLFEEPEQTNKEWTRHPVRYNLGTNIRLSLYIVQLYQTVPGLG